MPQLCSDEAYPARRDKSRSPMHAPRATPSGLPPAKVPISLDVDEHTYSSSSSKGFAGESMEGAPSSSCFTAELCAGSGGLSLELFRAGFSTVAVDHSANRHKSKDPCVKLDLAVDSGWAILYDLLESGRLLYAHGAPPCGTASRARERPVPIHLRRKGAPNPQPLRTDEFP